jgi:hypothetical protein
LQIDPAAASKVAKMSVARAEALFTRLRTDDTLVPELKCTLEHILIPALPSLEVYLEKILGKAIVSMSNAASMTFRGQTLETLVNNALAGASEAGALGTAAVAKLQGKAVAATAMYCEKKTATTTKMCAKVANLHNTSQDTEAAKHACLFRAALKIGSVSDVYRELGPQLLDEALDVFHEKVVTPISAKLSELLLSGWATVSEMVISLAGLIPEVGGIIAGAILIPIQEMTDSLVQPLVEQIEGGFWNKSRPVLLEQGTVLIGKTIDAAERGKAAAKNFQDTHGQQLKTKGAAAIKFFLPLLQKAADYILPGVRDQALKCTAVMEDIFEIAGVSVGFCDKVQVSPKGLVALAAAAKKAEDAVLAEDTASQLAADAPFAVNATEEALKLVAGAGSANQVAEDSQLAADTALANKAAEEAKQAAVDKVAADKAVENTEATAAAAKKTADLKAATEAHSVADCAAADKRVKEAQAKADKSGNAADTQALGKAMAAAAQAKATADADKAAAASAKRTATHDTAKAVKAAATAEAEKATAAKTAAAAAAANAKATETAARVPHFRRVWSPHAWTDAEQASIQGGQSEEAACKAGGNTFTGGGNGRKGYRGCGSAHCCTPVSADTATADAAASQLAADAAVKAAKAAKTKLEDAKKTGTPEEVKNATAVLTSAESTEAAAASKAAGAKAKASDATALAAAATNANATARDVVFGGQGESFDLVVKANLEITCERCSMMTTCSDAAIKGIEAVLQKNMGFVGSALVKIDGKDIHKKGSKYSCVDCERDDIDCEADVGEEKETALLQIGAFAGRTGLRANHGRGSSQGGLVVGYVVRGLGSAQSRSDEVLGKIYKASVDTVIQDAVLAGLKAGPVPSAMGATFRMGSKVMDLFAEPAPKEKKGGGFAIEEDAFSGAISGAISGSGSGAGRARVGATGGGGGGGGSSSTHESYGELGRLRAALKEANAKALAAANALATAEGKPGARGREHKGRAHFLWINAAHREGGGASSSGSPTVAMEGRSSFDETTL